MGDSSQLSAVGTHSGQVPCRLLLSFLNRGTVRVSDKVSLTGMLDILVQGSQQRMLTGQDQGTAQHLGAQVH